MVTKSYVMVYFYLYRVGSDEDWKCFRWYNSDLFSITRQQGVKISDQEVRNHAEELISTMNSRRDRDREPYLLYRIFRVGKRGRIIEKIYQEGRSVRLQNEDVLGTPDVTKYLR